MTHSNKRRGRYKCTTCNRNTIWAMGKAMSAAEVLEKFGWNQNIKS